MQAAAEQVNVTDAAFWPRLELASQYGYTSRGALESGGSSTTVFNQDTSRTLDAAVLLQLKFNIFNGNIDRINSQNARLDAKSSALAHADIENRIAGLMYELYKTFLKQVEVVGLETQNTVTAEQNLQLQKERYQTGAADSLDFRDAQVNVLRAQSTLITARYLARIALLNIQQLIGEISIN
jgi:outer membrane protein TolC